MIGCTINNKKIKSKTRKIVDNKLQKKADIRIKMTWTRLFKGKAKSKIIQYIGTFEERWKRPKRGWICIKNIFGSRNLNKKGHLQSWKKNIEKSQRKKPNTKNSQVAVLKNARHKGRERAGGAAAWQKFSKNFPERFPPIPNFINPILKKLFIDWNWSKFFQQIFRIFS